MRQGCWIVMVLLVLGLLVTAAGCGNVSVQGDAMTALESSTMDALGFVERVEADPGASPLVKGYATENFIQWRWFARSAKKDLNWGPKLPSEANTVSTGASTTMPAYGGMPLTDLAHGYE
jgi:hypothetical protein